MSDAPALVDAHHHGRAPDLRPQHRLDEPGHGPRWAAAVEGLLAGCSTAETEAVLAGTATAFHRLDPAHRKEGTSCC
ncbi:hypothetical protein ACFVHB_06765 [Kitasatospora sp. NPDC127111]|uniref:hypothetical protein n=1 Tax=Kitasatospora sp. NPDC127111 TaxID=3345363 RepID=UPI0036262B1D